VNELSEFIARS